MIDIHTHVLPGIDDGAADLDETLAMCRLAAAGGCEAVIATPHQRAPSWENTDRQALDALRARAQQAIGSELAIYAGGEIRIDSVLLDELESHPGSGLQTLAGSRYLLLEFSRRDPPPDPLALTHELLIAGWRPIFAHPEMIPFLAADLDLVARLAAAGALFQITSMCLTGDIGPRVQSVCERMLERRLAHFVASDTHGREWRPPDLHRARQHIANRWGEGEARRLTEDNPRRILSDLPLDPTEVTS